VVGDDFGRNLEGTWKEVFVAQLGISLEEKSKSKNYIEMVDNLAKI